METKFLTYTKDLTIAPEAGHPFNEMLSGAVPRH
jgi:hypothetical protein